MATPTCRTQKKYIVKQEHLLDMATKKAILSHVLASAGGAELGGDAEAETPLETKGARPACAGVTDPPGGVALDLDLIGKRDPNVIFHIYNMVKARERALNVPAGTPGSAPGPGRGPQPVGST
jgi:hypothetical protein